MTSRILLFDKPERFVAGTVGLPGERTFFLQVEQGPRIVSVALEKSQVQALAERLHYMVREIRKSDPTILITRYPVDDKPLSTPIEKEFIVGAIGIAFDLTSGLIQIDLQSLLENSDEEREFIDVDDLSGDQDILRVQITPGYALSFYKRALSVVSAGREPCPFCGGPINPEGHLCPRANGYRR